MNEVQELLNPNPSRFISEPGSCTVFDPLTGLMWSKKETDELSWDDANAACEASCLGGFADWRMPTRYELLTILDLNRYKPCLPPIFDTSGYFVWTSTQTAWTKDQAGSSRSFFFVGVYYGYVDYHRADFLHRALPVRRASPARQ